MINYQSQYLFSYRLMIGEPQLIGPCPDGLRINFPINGGEVQGPEFSGVVLPGEG